MPDIIYVKFHPIQSTFNFSRLFFHFHGNGGHFGNYDARIQFKTCQTTFLWSFIQFGALLIFPPFFGFHGNSGHFENFWKMHAHLLIESNIPVKFHYCLVSSFWEMCRTMVWLIFPPLFLFPWQRRPFWKFWKLSAHLLIQPNIPVKFHYFRFSSFREMCRTNIWRKKNNNKKKRSKHNMSPKLRLRDIIMRIS